MDPNTEDLEEDQQDQITGDGEAEANPEADSLEGTDALSIIDADQQEYQDAVAAAKAEEEGDSEEDGQKADADPEDDPAQHLPPREPEPEPQPEDIRIPKARFDQVASDARTQRDRAAQLERENAYLKGLVEGKGSAAKGEGEPEPEPQEDPVEVRKRELRAVRTQYDEGEISYADMAEKEEEIEAKFRKEPEPVNLPDPDDIANHVNQRNHVERKTAEIVEDNPWLRQQTPELTQALAASLDALRPQAIAKAKAAGYEIDDSPMGGLVVDAFVVQVAGEVGLDKIYAATAMKPAGDAPAPAPTPAPDQQKNGSSKQQQPGKPTAQQRGAKVDLSRRHPPDLSQAGTPAEPGAMPTEEEITAMTDEEMEALPESTRRKLLGM